MTPQATAVRGTVWRLPELPDGAIGANSVQRDNPALSHVKNVKVQFEDDLGCDFVMGESTCVSFASVQFLRQRGGSADYLKQKMERVRPHYQVKICLLLIDAEDQTDLMLEINRLAFHLDHALHLAWSYAEVAAFLSAFTLYQKKRVEDFLQPAKNKFLSPLKRAEKFLTALKPLTARDANVLLCHFGSLRQIVLASREALVGCPGIGAVKADALISALTTPFFLRATGDGDDDEEEIL